MAGAGSGGPRGGRGGRARRSTGGAAWRSWLGRRGRRDRASSPAGPGVTVSWSAHPAMLTASSAPHIHALLTWMAAEELLQSARPGRHEAEYLRPDTAPAVAVGVVLGLEDATVPDWGGGHGRNRVGSGRLPLRVARAGYGSGGNPTRRRSDGGTAPVGAENRVTAPDQRLSPPANLAVTLRRPPAGSSAVARPTRGPDPGSCIRSRRHSTRCSTAADIRITKTPGTSRPRKPTRSPKRFVGSRPPRAPRPNPRHPTTGTPQPC